MLQTKFENIHGTYVLYISSCTMTRFWTKIKKHRNDCHVKLYLITP